MATITIQEKLAKVLTHNEDFVEIPSKTSKARTFRRKHDGKLYFLGKCGSVRTGVSYSKSMALAENARQHLINRYNEIVEKEGDI